ncbi:MAG: branched-chain amino acid ABC transporter permease [Nitrospirota bacterium]
MTIPLMLLQQLSGNLTQGLILGAIYGMATMGLNLIFGVMKIVNVGHGAFIMLGTFVSFAIFTYLGLTPIVAIPLAFIVGFALGSLFFYFIIGKLTNAPELNSLLATFAIGMLIEEVTKFIFGSEWRGFTWDVGRVTLPFTVLPITKIYAFIISILVVIALYLWLRMTRSGTALRAVVEDKEGARVCGINVDRMYALSFSIGIGLTVMSGVILTFFISVGLNPYMGGAYTLRAFVIAVLGGLGSPLGAFFGGVIFGLVENGSYTLLSLIPGIEPFSLTRFVTFFILLIILLVRPTGLLGVK